MEECDIYPASKEARLDGFTDEARKSPVINWYRTPLPPGVMKELHTRSDAKGFAQTLGFLGTLMATGGMAIFSFAHWPWYVTAALVFLHGMVVSFMINAVHELGHGTVFRTKWLNAAFTPLFAFLGWINHEMFGVSHVRHHRYTLHPPDDLEVVLPLRMMVRHFFITGIVDLPWMRVALREVVRIARGRFQGEWELALFPESAPAKRVPPVRWARILLAGHGLILVVSVWAGWWIVPVVISFAPFVGKWLFFLCNNTQHIGLRDNVPDFRLCCRTFTLNPVARFLYWHMNYHTEHHMYAAVPCYNLHRLHAVIRHDLPPCRDGIVAVWKEIIAIQKRQEAEPGYQHHAAVPGGAAPEPSQVQRAET